MGYALLCLHQNCMHPPPNFFLDSVQIFYQISFPYQFSIHGCHLFQLSVHYMSLIFLVKSHTLCFKNVFIIYVIQILPAVSIITNVLGFPFIMWMQNRKIKYKDFIVDEIRLGYQIFSLQQNINFKEIITNLRFNGHFIICFHCILLQSSQIKAKQ